MPLAPPANVLASTPIYRMVHLDNLDTLLRRDAIHAPAACPSDGLPYVGIHDAGVQVDRAGRRVPCGPGGAIGDYVGFYFGPRSPMLYRIHTGLKVQQVAQARIVYLVTSAQAVAAAGLRFVFTDRHSLAAVAAFRDDLSALAMVDFAIAYAWQWNTTPEHPDRQEKKQAEFLVHGALPWSLIDTIGVLNPAVAAQVAQLLDGHPGRHRPRVMPAPAWYY